MQVLCPEPRVLPIQVRLHLPARAACPPATTTQAAAPKGARCKWGGTSGGPGHGSRLGFILSPVLQDPSLASSDEEDEELCMLEWALSLAMVEAGFRYSRHGHEMLLVEFSDSD